MCTIGGLETGNGKPKVYYFKIAMLFTSSLARYTYLLTADKVRAIYYQGLIHITKDLLSKLSN